MRTFRCSICGYVYDESAGIPEQGIASGTKWEELPDDFVCPICAAPKSVFKPLEETQQAVHPANPEGVRFENLKELSAGELSAICSNLAKGCEKQRLMTEMDAFNRIADYFRARMTPENDKTLIDAAKILDDDIEKGYAAANAAAKKAADRGAQRSLVWSEKVSAMAKSLLERFAKEGDALLKNTSIYVCDVCGFIYLGETPPEICPVCKVPRFKITQVERRRNYAGT